MNNLATVLSQGQKEQAEEMHRQELSLSEMVLGKEHPDTLPSIYNLAYVLRKEEVFFMERDRCAVCYVRFY